MLVSSGVFDTWPLVAYLGILTWATCMISNLLLKFTGKMVRQNVLEEGRHGRVTFIDHRKQLGLSEE
eukprot:8192995-Prorocentrum_lima.AAC.1